MIKLNKQIEALEQLRFYDESYWQYGFKFTYEIIEREVI